jgi:F-type H+-transporting ATPase subunit a
MEITPDIFIYWQWHGLKLNATIAITWLNMVLLVVGARLITRRLQRAGAMSRWQNLLEVLVSGMEEQIHDMGLAPPREFLPFLGSLFLFVLFSNLLAIIPGYVAPTGSLSTTTALAICVFLSVPIWGIQRRGLRGYLRLYIKPSVFMLPFNIMGELSRTLALAVRLFGNVMSGSMIAGILLSIAPLFFPVLMQLLGLITGVIQAYIFAVLAAVYIAAAAQMEQRREGEDQGQRPKVQG